MVNKKIVAVILVLVISMIVSTASAIFYNGKYSEKLSDYGRLETDFNEKNNAYNVLGNNYNSLQNDYQTLQSEQQKLQTRYNGLEELSNKIRESYTKLNEEYKKLTGQYYTLEGQLDEFTVRYGEGSDCEKFITPDNPVVKQKTTIALGHFSDGECTWDEMQTICSWVGKNIAYNYDTYNGNIQQSYQYPEETLTSKRGDCEDHAVLMASMCKAEQSDLGMWCALVSYVKNGEILQHELVFVNVADDNLYIFEPTSSNGWHSSKSMTEPLAISEYEQWRGCSQFTVLKIFNDKIYKEFNNNQEFFNWF